MGWGQGEGADINSGVLESSLGLPCVVRARDEGWLPAPHGKNAHVPHPSTERSLGSSRPRMCVEPAPSLPTSCSPKRRCFRAYGPSSREQLG